MDVKSKETSSPNVMIEPWEQIFLSDLCCGPPMFGRGYTFQSADRHYYMLSFIHPGSAGHQKLRASLNCSAFGASAGETPSWGAV